MDRMKKLMLLELIAGIFCGDIDYCRLYRRLSAQGDDATLLENQPTA